MLREREKGVGYDRPIMPLFTLALPPYYKKAIQTCFNYVPFLGEYAKKNPELADGLKLAEIAELRVRIYYIE